MVMATEAEGPGVRHALWLQGCPLRCPGCCNPEMLSFSGGTERSITELVAELCTVEAEGISLLGGEPFAQAEGASRLAMAVQEQGLSVMIFTGFTLAQLRARKDPATEALLAHCDILVDGPFQSKELDTKRSWIGSSNQEMHFLSDRYDGSEPAFHQGNSVEIRLRPGSLSVNGWPSASRAFDPRLRRRDS